MDTGYVYKITFTGKVFWDGHDWVDNYQTAMVMTYQSYIAKWSHIQRIVIKFESNHCFL